MDLITYRHIRALLSGMGGHLKKNTNDRLTKNVTPNSRASTGAKWSQTRLALTQFRKQWSIVSALVQLAQRALSMYPQVLKELRTLIPRRVINHKISFLKFSQRLSRTRSQCSLIEKSTPRKGTQPPGKRGGKKPSTTT